MKIKQNYSISNHSPYSCGPGKTAFKWIKAVVIVGGLTLAGLGINKFVEGYIENRDGTGMTHGKATTILISEGKPEHLMYSDPRFFGPTDKMFFGGGMTIAGVLITLIGIIVQRKR